mgnify:CR=1 FL=1
MPLKHLQERLVTITKNLTQPPWSQAPTLARPSGWLTKENFYLFFYKQIRLKCVFLDIVTIWTANNMKKVWKILKFLVWP